MIIFYRSRKRRIEDIFLYLVNTNILALSLFDHYLLINSANGKKEKIKNFPKFFFDGLFLNKNRILKIIKDYYNEMWEYTILNKEGINIGEYAYSKKKIFDFTKGGGLIKSKGIKIKNKIIFFISIIIILKLFKY